MSTSWYCIKPQKPRSNVPYFSKSFLSFFFFQLLEGFGHCLYGIFHILLQTVKTELAKYGQWHILCCNSCIYPYRYNPYWASQVTETAKNLPAMQDTWVWSLGWEDPLEKGTAIHSSILAWRIPINRGAWQATVHGVTKSRTWLSN